MQQREDDVAAAEDEGARAEERVEEGERPGWRGEARKRKAHQQDHERHERGDADPAAHRAWVGDVLAGSGRNLQEPADERPRDDDRDVGERGGPR